jgi:peptide/nickel transport system permease protein
MVAFLLFWTVPNVDPAFQLGGGERSTPESRARATEQYGLDDPLPVQYVRLMEQIVNGDVQCFYGCGSLRSAFADALPVTFWLIAGAALIAIATGLGLALTCVRWRGRWPDRAILTLATAASSVPSLALAALLWSYLAYKWELFPNEGYVGLTENPFDWARHLLLPWIAAALPFAGVYTQVIRAALLEAVDTDWARTARAKGLSERQVLRRHVLRNALIPPVSLWGLDFSHAFGGFALYVEVVFAIPGVGLLTAQTLDQFDLPAMVGIGAFLALVVVLVNALVDVVMALIDPRIRRGDARAG